MIRQRLLPTTLRKVLQRKVQSQCRITLDRLLGWANGTSYLLKHHHLSSLAPLQKQKTASNLAFCAFRCSCQLLSYSFAVSSSAPLSNIS